MRKTTLLVVVLLGATITPSWAQNFGLGNVATFPGATHRPVIVENEYGSYNQALRVYKDTAHEVYVPDVAAPNGYMRLRELMLFGTFLVKIYVYNTKTEQTAFYFVSVDVTKKTIDARTDPFALPYKFTFADAPPFIGQSISAIVQLMQHEIKIQHVQR